MREGYPRSTANSHTGHSYSSPKRARCGRTRAAIESGAGCVYNARFNSAIRTLMEAEQLNSIANRLVDIAQRATELRRYL